MDVNELKIKASLEPEDRALLVSLKTDVAALFTLLQSTSTSGLAAPAEQEEPMSKKETACFLRCSLPSLTKRVAEGKIPVHRMGRRVWFFKSELIKAMASTLTRRAA